MNEHILKHDTVNKHDVLCDFCPVIDKVFCINANERNDNESARVASTQSGCFYIVFMPLIMTNDAARIRLVGVCDVATDRMKS